MSWAKKNLVGLASDKSISRLKKKFDWFQNYGVFLSQKCWDSKLYRIFLTIEDRCFIAHYQNMYIQKMHHNFLTNIIFFLIFKNLYLQIKKREQNIITNFNFNLLYSDVTPQIFSPSLKRYHPNFQVAHDIQSCNFWPIFYEAKNYGYFFVSTVFFSEK